MQLFRSEEDVAVWCEATGTAVGAVFSPQQLWDLATRWYDDRFDVVWKRRSVEQRQKILDEVGLTGEFWRLNG